MEIYYFSCFFFFFWSLCSSLEKERRFVSILIHFKFPLHLWYFVKRRDAAPAPTVRMRTLSGKQFCVHYPAK
uniref:Putative secreted protein n=1 Tax=Anopheles darlingi TaxID=43151 RepID=A0A2M4DBL0_ANODA